MSPSLPDKLLLLQDGVINPAVSPSHHNYEDSFGKGFDHEGSEKERIEVFVTELNQLTHQTPGPVKGKGAKTALKGKLTNEQIITLAELKNLSAFVLPGWEQWCPTFGGFWRAIAIETKPGQEQNMNSIRAIIVEDCDSPYLGDNFQIFMTGAG